MADYIRPFILRGNFTVVRKKLNSGESHLHYGRGSYLNMNESIKKMGLAIKPGSKDVSSSDIEAQEPTLIFQEGIATPLGKKCGLEDIAFEIWYLPVQRGMHKRPHTRGGQTFGKIFNWKTLPLWIIGLVLAWHFLGPIFAGGAAPENKIAENAKVVVMGSGFLPAFFKKSKKSKSELKKSEPKKELSVEAIVLDESIGHYDLGSIENLPTIFKHKDKILKINTKFLFKEKDWLGRIRRWYLFYDLINLPNGKGNPNSIEPLGLRGFNPEEDISDEEADLYIHETKTSGAVSNIVQKLRVGGGFKFWMFIVIAFVIAVISILYFKLR